VAHTQFQYTVTLLSHYSAVALQNAGELVEEASLLLARGHRARAYFLAVAGIEEIGKAVLAFDGQGRNLKDSAVTAKLRRAMEDHSQKVTAAFTPILLASPEPRQVLMPLVDMMIHLKRGREPSMYTDIHYESGEVQQPMAVVRDVAAQDCVRLAGDCLRAAQRHVSERTPLPRSAADDALFAMKSEQVNKILNSEGFWRYYIERMEGGAQDFAAAVITYQREYVAKGRTYHKPAGEGTDDHVQAT
jgi:AbiV family abortive infection protein